MKSKISIIIVLILMIQLPENYAVADSTDVNILQATSQLKSWDIPLSGNCKGRVDQPHISRHVKGTVNVVLSINCPKEFLSITGVLFRYPVRIPSDINIRHTSGNDKIKMNLAIPCKTDQGASVNTYYVTGTFLATGHFPVSKTFNWPVPC